MADGIELERSSAVDPGWAKYGSTSFMVLPGVRTGGASVMATSALAANYVYYFPVESPVAWTLDGLKLEVTTAAAASSVARLAVYTSNVNWQPETRLLAPATELAIDATGVKSLSSLATPLPAGKLLLAYHANGGATLRSLRATPPGGPSIAVALGATPLNSLQAVSKAYAVFADPGTAWNVDSPTSSNFEYPVFCLRNA